MKQRLPVRVAERTRESAPEEASEEGELSVPSLDNGVTPILILLGLAAINARGYKGVLFTPGATPGDDLSSHFAEASTLASRLRGGDLDFWFSETQLGYPLFMTYTPLPTMLIGAALCFAKDLDSELQIFKYCIAVIWMVSPAAWYVGSRVWNYCADKQGFGIGINALLGKGLLAHSVACAFLPLWLGTAYSRISSLSSQPLNAHGAALQASWSAVVPRFSRQDATCAIFFALVLMSNSFTAVFSVLAGAGMIAVDMHRPAAFMRGVVWLSAIVVVAACCNLFWMIRFLSHVQWQGGLPFKHWPNFQGNSVQQIVTIVLNGEVFDLMGFPLATLCFLAAFFGARASEERVSERLSGPAKRGLPPALSAAGELIGDAKDNLQAAEDAFQTLATSWGSLMNLAQGMSAPGRCLFTLRFMFVASFGMMLGRKTLPILYETLPFHDDVESIRYTIGVQAAGIMLGGITLAALVRCLWEALCGLSRAPLYRLTAFMTMSLLLIILLAMKMDARVQRMPYSKNKSFNIHSQGYANVVETIKNWREPEGWAREMRHESNTQGFHSVGGAGGRYMVFKGATTHYTLNLLAHVTGKPAFITYSRGYHDTLSFWHLEHFTWSSEMFRLYNIRQVVIAKKETTSIPPYFETTYPKCPAGMSLANCTTKYGHGYSIHQVTHPYGYFELVSAPIVVCTSEAGLKAPATRYLLRNLTMSMFHRGSLPAICSTNCNSCRAMTQLGKGGSTLQVHSDSAKHVTREGLKGVQQLQEAVATYSRYTLEVPKQYKLSANMDEVVTQLEQSLTHELHSLVNPRSRQACNVFREEKLGETYSASIRCLPGFPIEPSDVVLFKMSFHPLWTASVVGGGGGHDLELMHMAPNLIGIPLSSLAPLLEDGHEVRMQLHFTSPRDQHILLILALVFLCILSAVSLASRKCPGERRGSMSTAPVGCCGVQSEEDGPLEGRKED